MKKILLIDFAYIGPKGGGHNESYLMKLLEILTSQDYYVYICTGNNTKFREAIKYARIFGKYEIVDFDLHALDKFLRKILLIADSFFFKKYLKFIQFSSLNNLLNTKKLISKIDKNISVFFAHTDSALPSLPLSISCYFFPKKWIGFCIIPSYQAKSHFGYRISRILFLKEKHFSLPSCKSILVLHPVYKKFFAKRFPCLSCFEVPELVDFELAKPNLALSESSNNSQINLDLLNKIYKQAQGRAIIAMLGNITSRKNLPLFLTSTANLDPSQYFILLLGKLKIDNILQRQHILQKLEFHRKKLVNNSLIDIDYFIQGEQEFYELIKLSDIIFLHYTDHPFSSNILAKAMACKKLVITNQGYLMEKTVKRYQWRAVVDADPQKIVATIEEMASSNFSINESGYQAFIQDYSPKNFEKAVLQACGLLEAIES